MNAPCRPGAGLPLSMERHPATPMVFGPARGWLHPAQGHRGVLMVGAQGFEAFCAYQSWRVLGDLFAEAGLTALRFDWPGEGDSLGSPDDAGRTDAWFAAIREAWRLMHEDLGLTEVSVVGLRLGGLLAAAALWDDSRLRRLDLLAPPLSGAAYVREQRAAALLLAQIRPGCGVGEAGIDLCGHLLSRETMTQVSALGSWNRAPRPDLAVRIAVAPGADPGGIEAQLRTCAGRVENAVVEGAEALFVGPTASLTPWTAWRACAAWHAAPDHPNEAASVPAARAVAGWARSDRLAGPDFVEQAVVFGAGGHLAGILCRPRDPLPQAAPVLFLNAGANAHVGWARMHVDQARALAAEGVASLRMDASGIGDSCWYAEGPRPHLYSAAHRTDIASAVDVLMHEGFAAPLLVGLCAGAFNAMHALAQDARLTRAVAVNPLRFHWTEGESLDAAERAITQLGRVYAGKIGSARSWKRLLRGDISLRKLGGAARAVAQSALGRIETTLTHATGLEFPQPEDTRRVRALFRALSARGARLDLVFSENDAGQGELVRHLGPEARLQQRYGGLTLHRLPGADHDLTPAAARRALLDLLRAVLRRTAPPA